jgi:hypothetical protein
MKVDIPHAGEGTHTLTIAIEVDDTVLADPQLPRRILDRVSKLIEPILAERRAVFVGDRFLTEHGVTLDDLRRYDRREETLVVRQDLALLLRRHGWSYPRIGRLLYRDHTTIMHSVKAAEAREVESTRRRPGRPERTCEDCSDKSVGGPWCREHYLQHRRAS